MSKNKQKFVIIDSNALIHRAFHALPPLTNKQGVMTNAVYGFTTILMKSIKDIKPDYIAATFDRKEKTFRHEEYKEYKAQRKKQPDELYAQIPLVKEVLASLNIPVFEKAGFEADDLIGTIARLKSVDRPDIETIIITGDQDTFQLVDGNTKVLTPHKGLSETKLYGEKEVIEKFQGLKPSQLIDYKALRGDPSDNIPGVKGIGEKGAIDLLTNFKNLENIYKNIESGKIKQKTKELLAKNRENAFMSKKLAAIITDINIDFNLQDCAFNEINKTKAAETFQKLNFKKLLFQLNALKEKTNSEQGDLFASDKKPKTDYQTVKNPEEFIKQLKKQKIFCFDTETTGLDPFKEDLLGISFSWKKNQAFYLPKKEIKNVKKELTAIFKNEKIQKIGHNLKFDVQVLNQAGIEANGLYFDTMIASYLLNPGHRQHNLDNLAFVELGRQTQPITDLIGQGKDQKSLSDVPIEKVSWYSCEDADVTFQICQKLEKELKDQNIFGLFIKLEMPLIQVLKTIEANGVKIDAKLLKKMSVQEGEKIEKLEKKIYDLAKTKFNIASPLQLKKILFEKLKISTAGLHKTKTGISTAAGELEKLKKEHKIIDLILQYRESAKLKSTYLDALPKLINPNDKRVHTSFNQTITATGRLSSSEPNLQNIPIKTQTGQKIRQAFIAEKNNLILKADYSQIELRIAASLANDEKMLKIFKDKGDIHTQTAAFINEIKPEQVTKELRRQAKEVNFGVLYGMGAWGLASRTGISNQRAQEFIDKYFQTFKKVKQYIDETIKMAREKGYVETFYGRRRYLPEINSGIQQVRSAAERMATNMPIQGTAADLIKLAMIKINNELPKISPRSKMILQVHDELVLEVPEKEIKQTAEFIQNAMNQVCKLRAPIETEVSAGKNWGQTEKI